MDSSYSAFLIAARKVVKESLLKGSTPKVCPICKNPVDELVLHHWTGDGVMRKAEALMGGVG